MREQIITSSAGTPSTSPRDAEDNLRILNTFAISLLKQNRLEDLLWSIAENIGALLGFEDSVIYLVHSGVLHQAAAFGVKNPMAREIHNPILLKFGEGVVGRVAVTQQPVLIADTSHCDIYINDDFPGLSEISVPVVYQGKVLAVFDAEASSINRFDEADLSMLTSMANISAPRIASAQADEQRRKVEQQLTRAKQELELHVKERTSALVQSMRELEHKQHLLHLTMLAVGDGLLATNAAGEILLASDAALRIIKATRAEIIGRPLGEVYKTMRAEEDGANAGQPSTIPSVTETQAPQSSTKILRHETGEEFVLDEVLSPIRDTQGNNVGIVVVFRDVTLQRVLERKTKKVQRMESLGVLAGGIAHDFNNILVGILGRINLAQNCHGDQAILMEAMAEAENGCLAAGGLTKELLAFAKGGAPVKSVGSLRELIVKSARFCLHGSPVSLQLDLDEDLHAIEMDAVQISQALNNLVLNAIQAMPDGGVLTICARNESGLVGRATGPSPHLSGNHVSITFEDTGSGIEGHARERIFDPYFTTKNTHSGLGLATSYLIIQRHKGLLRLLKSSERGTQFEIRLPSLPHTQQPNDCAETMQPSTDVGLKILLMDDDPAVRKTMAAMLERIGQSVVQATTGEEAIELLRKAQQSGLGFDLAILDLTVRGGMGGLKAIKHLRALDPNLKAVVISGYSDDTVMACHREHGFDERLAKPFTLNQLRGVIASVSSAAAKD